MKKVDIQYLLNEVNIQYLQCHVATSNRASKRYEMSDPWPFTESGAVVGAGGTFYPESKPPEHFMRSGSHSRRCDFFPGAGVRATQILPVSDPYQRCVSGAGAPGIYLKLN